jgi:hypothetical protein
MAKIVKGLLGPVGRLLFGAVAGGRKRKQAGPVEMVPDWSRVNDAENRRRYEMLDDDDRRRGNAAAILLGNRVNKPGIGEVGRVISGK